MWFFFFQAEDGIRDLVRSRGLGDVYKRQGEDDDEQHEHDVDQRNDVDLINLAFHVAPYRSSACLLYTSDAADERSSVDLGGRRIIKKKTKMEDRGGQLINKDRKGDNDEQIQTETQQTQQTIAQ